MGRILLLGVVLSLVTVGTLPAMASASDHKFKVECTDTGCLVGVNCDGGTEVVYVCVSYDPTTATSFIPQGDSPYDVDTRTEIYIHEYEISNPLGGSVEYLCAAANTHYDVHTGVWGVGIGPDPDACFGGFVENRQDVKTSPSVYTEAPPETTNHDAIQLCDGQATVKVLGVGIEKFPLKTAC